ncbi:MAG: hypothetical protein LBL53_00815 [Endomicrobium sp.]|jgi:16S rRNA processing protein RimM|nr:hypothetical protein [Endomicrobium sp.]
MITLKNLANNFILGFEVFSKIEYIGIVENFESNGKVSTLVIKCNNRKIFVPVLISTINSVNLTRKKIFINLPKQFLYIYKNINCLEEFIIYDKSWVLYV